MMTQLATRSLEVKTTLERNLAALSIRSPQTARRIQESEGRSDLEFIETGDSGALSATLEGRQLASRRRPLAEAERLAETIDIEKHGGLVALGFGLGHHVAAAAKLIGQEGLIVVFEPDVALLRSVFERIDHSAWLGESQVVILTDPEDRGAMSEATRGAEPVLALGVHILEHIPSRARLGEKATTFGATFGGVISAVRTVVVTAMVQMDITYRNLFMNLDHYVMGDGVAALRDLYNGRPAILVSAGPSLRKSIALLQRAEVRERFVIVAVQTALKPLLAAGVKPHFVTALDYHEISKRFYEGLTREDLEGVTLVAEPEANPAILESFDGDIRLCTETMLDAIAGEDLSFDHGELERGATVAHLAYYLARYLGCDPVALVGQDLGFTDHVYYGRGAAIHETWAPELNEFNTLEMMELERVLRGRSSLRPAEDQRGRPIYTDEQMWTYLTQFERDFLRDSEQGMSIIDASGGVSKEHTTSQALADVIDEYVGQDKEPIAPPPRPEPRASKALRRRLDDRLRDLRADVGAIATGSRQTHQLLGEMLERHDDQPRVNALIDKVNELNREVRSKDLAFRVVNRLNQTGGFKRARSDRAMRLDEGLTGVALQRAQIERDRINVEWIGDAAEELSELLEASISALHGGEKRVRSMAPLEAIGEAEMGPKSVDAVVALDGSSDGRYIAEVVERLSHCKRVTCVHVLADDAERAAQLLASARSGIEIDIHASSGPVFGERLDGVRTARVLAGSSWRGGLCAMTVYDEALAPEPTLALMREHVLDGALIVGADWRLLDPALCDELIERFDETPSGPTVIFSQAPPGLAGCVLERSLLEEIVETERGVGGFRSLGGVLGYVPVQAKRDPIAENVCVQIDAPKRTITGRLIPDSSARIEAMQAMGDERAPIDARAERAQLREAGAGPAHLILELTTRRLTKPALGLLCALPEGAPDREVDAASARRLLRELAEARPDAVVTFAGAGDPLLHDAFENLVRCAGGELGLGTHVRTDLGADEHVESLLRCGVDIVSVNLMASTGDVYRSLMGVSGFEDVAKRLDALRERGGRADGLPLMWIVPRMARCDATHEQLEAFYDRAKLRFGAAMIEQVFDDSLIAAPEALGKPASVLRRDWRRRMCALADGRVIACERDIDPGGAFAMWSEGALLEIWRDLLTHRESVAASYGLDHPDLWTGW